MSTRHTPRSERLPAIFEEIESTTHSLVTYAIKNRSMGGGEGHRRALTKLLWRHRFTHPSAHTIPYSSYSGPIFTLVDVCGIPEVLGRDIAVGLMKLVR